jgi:glycosyltransferase involved in cell wall biosynthesis
VKAGILGHEFVKWSGGVDFLCTVVDSLLEALPEGAELHLFIPDVPPSWNWRRVKFRAMFKRHILRQVPSVDAPSLAEIEPEAFSDFGQRLNIHHIEPGRRALIHASGRLKIDVVLPAFISLGTDFPLPWLGYVYDFQHKYFPENFTPEDCLGRDKHFAGMLAEARAVIVNSRAAAGDISKFVPQAAARVFALPFAPAPRMEWMREQPEVLGRYGIAPPFFLISNQFWIHKDHTTAFEAFRRVAAIQPAVSLVCTGITRDHRRPNYFPGLMDKVKGWRLEERIRVLGQIPKLHQIEIMKHACAVLQPTRFEGGPGGGSVYDAVSMDVPVIVSDLPVNREIDNCQVEFFPPGDAAELARLMDKRLSVRHVRKPWDELVALGRRRRAACGQVLWRAVDSVI